MDHYLDDADGAVLRRLEARGIDLSRPLKIEFMADAPDEKTAGRISADLQTQGFMATAEFDPGEPDENGIIDPNDPDFGPSWTVYLERMMVPDYSALLGMQQIIDEVARRHGGKADGWGVLI
jgi:hypothetical protein